MTDTYKKIFKLLRCSLNSEQLDTEDFYNNSEEQWYEIYKESAKQGVLSIVYDSIVTLPKELYPPRMLLIQWAYNTDCQESRCRKQIEIAEKIANIFGEYGIHTMILKGLGLGELYPNPLHRPCGDIDIWLYGKHDDSIDIIKSRLNKKVRYDSEHHTKFTYNGITIENHYDIINTRLHRSAKKIENILRNQINEPLSNEILNKPSPDFNAIFLIRHMSSHFAAEKIGLRHLCDWAMFLRSQGNKVNWPYIIDIYKQYNMLSFVECINSIINTNLGIKIYPETCICSDERLKNKVLNEILYNAEKEMNNKFDILKRWLHNYWKFRITYSDSIIETFIRSSWFQVIDKTTSIQKQIKAKRANA